ncbi:MAG TPA: carboxypeptidase-like regulatory domain-containing protein [Edaphobacter sp.]
MRSTIQHAFMLRRWFPVLVIAASCFAQAQPHTPTIIGTVTDTAGASIPKADVSLETANGTAHQIKTDTEGRFEIAAKAGDYTLKISAQGFTSYQKPVHLTPAASVTENIILTVGSFSGPIIGFGPQPPPIELLDASLTSTLPLSPLPPFKLRIKKSIPLPK